MPRDRTRIQRRTDVPEHLLWDDLRNDWRLVEGAGAVAGRPVPLPRMWDAPVTGARSCPYMGPVPVTISGRVLREFDFRSPAVRSITRPRRWVGFRFRDLSAASAMAVRSLGPPTTMSFRLAIGH